MPSQASTNKQQIHPFSSDSDEEEHAASSSPSEEHAHAREKRHHADHAKILSAHHAQHEVWVATRAIFVLTQLVLAYTVIVCLGAVCFWALERPAELDRRSAAQTASALYSLPSSKLDASVAAGLLTAAEAELLRSYGPAAVGATDFQDWSFAGAFFFSSTVVTTIGYGTFAPVTEYGRTFLMCYAIVGIAAAAPVFVHVGDVIVSRTQACVSNAETRPEITEAAKVRETIHQMFLRHDADHSGHLNRWEIGECVQDMGIGITEEELADLIDQADETHHGLVCEAEFAQLISEFTHHRHLDDVDEAANAHLTVTVAVAVVMMLGGAAGFSQGYGWTYLDSLYFCVVTLTSLGLGDFAPIVHEERSGGGHGGEEEEGSSVSWGTVIAWFIYVQFGLAVVAVVITIVGDKLKAQALRAHHVMKSSATSAAAAARNSVLFCATVTKKKFPRAGSSVVSAGRISSQTSDEDEPDDDEPGTISSDVGPREPALSEQDVPRRLPQPAF